MKPEELPLASLSAVKAVEKQRWLALFEDDAVLQDPVGVSETDPTGKGHIGKAAISAFFDTFPFKPGQFDFEIHDIIPRGEEAAVKLTMKITGADGNTYAINAINIYKVSPAGKIASLRSFW